MFSIKTGLATCALSLAMLLSATPALAAVTSENETFTCATYESLSFEDYLDFFVTGSINLPDSTPSDGVPSRLIDEESAANLASPRTKNLRADTVSHREYLDDWGYQVTTQILSFFDLEFCETVSTRPTSVFFPCFPFPNSTCDPEPEPTYPPEEPVESPTEEPTEQPTVEPTEEPTEQPTEEPMEQPTEEPTVEPTVERTDEPTVNSTPEPPTPPASDSTIDLPEGLIPDKPEGAQPTTDVAPAQPANAVPSPDIRDTFASQVDTVTSLPQPTAPRTVTPQTSAVSAETELILGENIRAQSAPSQSRVQTVVDPGLAEPTRRILSWPSTSQTPRGLARALGILAGDDPLAGLVPDNEGRQITSSANEENLPALSSLGILFILASAVIIILGSALIVQFFFRQREREND